MSVDVLDMTCPKCGNTMTADRAHGNLNCPYCGQIIEALNKSYAGYITGYKNVKDVKADILSHQSSAVTLQERKA